MLMVMVMMMCGECVVIVVVDICGLMWRLGLDERFGFSPRSILVVGMLFHVKGTITT